MKAEPNGGQVILSSSLSPVLRSLNASIVSPGAGFESTGLAGLLFRNLRIRVIKDLKNDILCVLHKEFQTTAQSDRLNCRSICDWGRISCCQSSFQVSPRWPKKFKLGVLHALPWFAEKLCGWAGGTKELSPGLNMQASPYTWINQGCQLFWRQFT